jgi:hypothetical protein
VARGDETSVTAAAPATPHHRNVIDDFNPATVRELDVRDLLAAGQEPLRLILEQALELPPGGVLHVRSPFEPVPLFRMMGDRGFAWRSQQFDDQDWSSWFWRADQPPGPAGEAPTASPAPLIDLLAPTGWGIALEDERSDGVVVRVEIRDPRSEIP